MRLRLSIFWLVWSVLGVRLFAQTPPVEPALAPLTGAERARIFVHDSFWSPGVFFSAVGPAIGRQLSDEPREWRQGSAGFARRAASSFGRNVVFQSYHAAGAAVLGHEVRYIPVRRKSTWARVVNALTSDFVTYNAAGDRVLNIATIGAAVGSEYTTNLWLPDRYRTASRTFLADHNPL